MTAKRESIGKYAASFRFLAANEDSRLAGTVIVRDGEMVLDISEGVTPYGPYLIIGTGNEYWFEGTNSAHGMKYHVKAKWVQVGGTYIGTWIEGDEDYLFSFELENPR